MEMALEAMGTPPDDYFVFRVLSPISIQVASSARATAGVLLDHVHQATDLLLHTSIDSRVVPGRWSVSRQGDGEKVQLELVQGPLQGLALNVCVDDLEGGASALTIDGSYLAPVKPLQERRRAQQLAEALRAGLAQRLQHELALSIYGRVEK